LNCPDVEQPDAGPKHVLLAPVVNCCPAEIPYTALSVHVEHPVMLSTPIEVLVEPVVRLSQDK